MKEKRFRRSILRVMFSFDNLMIVIATIGAIALAYVIPKNFDFLDPVGGALSDMDITDMVFSQFRDESEIGVDTNIVLINIGLASREEIAFMLDRINAHDPKVIGIDAFFRQPKDSVGDSLLIEAMQNTNNLVLVSKVAYKEESREGQQTAWQESTADPDREFDTLETSHPMFNEHAVTGFSNMVIEQKASFMTVRSASLKEKWHGGLEPAFAVRLAEFVDPEAAREALAREETKEVINYHGNLHSFYHIDVDQALDETFDISVVRDKIVLMGYMGPDVETPSLEDIFYTPLNPKYVGRSFPDMYGVVIHANVVTMILRGTYIGQMSVSTSFIVGFAVLVFNVILFTYMYTRFENWYDVVAVSTQLAEAITIGFLNVFIFDKFGYKLALTPALVSVFLVGTVHDLYQDSIKKLILSAWNKIVSRRKSASSSS